MTTTREPMEGVKCDGCNDQFENGVGFTVMPPGYMLDDALNDDWIDTEPDGHWCPRCQRDGLVPDDGGHRSDEADDPACVKCDEEWPCYPFRLMSALRAEST